MMALNLNQVPCKKNLWPDYIQILLSRKLQENQRENMFHNYVREGIWRESKYISDFWDLCFWYIASSTTDNKIQPNAL